MNDLAKFKLDNEEKKLLEVWNRVLEKAAATEKMVENSLTVLIRSNRKSIRSTKTKRVRRIFTITLSSTQNSTL